MAQKTEAGRPDYHCQACRPLYASEDDPRKIIRLADDVTTRRLAAGSPLLRRYAVV